MTQHFANLIASYPQTQNLASQGHRCLSLCLDILF